MDREQRGMVERKLILIQNKIGTGLTQVISLTSIQFCQPEWVPVPVLCPESCD